VYAVLLHGAGDSVDVTEEEWFEWDVVFFGEQGIGCIELVDVIVSIIGWEGDAAENDVSA